MSVKLLGFAAPFGDHERWGDTMSGPRRLLLRAGPQAIAFFVAMFPLSAISDQNCHPPDWINDPSIPACPTTGSLILPETAPAAGVVVSKLIGIHSDPAEGAIHRVDSAPLNQLVLDVLESSETHLPKIFLNGVPSDEVREIRKRIDEYCSDATHGCLTKADQWKAALVQVSGTRYRWQQDFFKSTFDSSTGLPVIRPIRGYFHGINGEQEASRLSNAGRSSCVSEGETIPPKSIEDAFFSNAEMGGNITGLPGGLCLHGSGKKWTNQYCGSSDNEVLLNVDWLAIGHVDEIVGVVPNRNQKAPCNFAITWASPKRALDLMKELKNKEQPFMDFFKDPSHSVLTTSSLATWLCDKTRAFRKKKINDSPVNVDPGSKDSSAGRAALLPQWLIQFLVPNSQAEEPQFGCKGMDPPTNGEIAQIMEQEEYNTAIELVMESNRDLLLKKVTERTGCKNIRSFPVPNLFMGGAPIWPDPNAMIELNGRKRPYRELTFAERDQLPPSVRWAGLPRASAVGLLPNPTNALLIEKTVISPNPWNQAFRDDLKKTYSRLGLNYREVDTWDAHENQGDLHCSTNSMRVCRPVINGRGQ